MKIYVGKYVKAVAFENRRVCLKKTTFGWLEEPDNVDALRRAASIKKPASGANIYTPLPAAAAVGRRRAGQKLKQIFP
ncbi:hypothetical protein [Methylocella tundrae]|uniref:Uncharacterized protein n=1 Tax=Methylocella tundrae TaxID=227605 RepID=A0A4U8YXV0_METTU|nr:hypothetical protein [Methylocella tundrae]WPP06170.1 hypothetical protein SIN04_10350 [Methylocella tundrae]VFU08801.1 protein of unknown function [Methylocella tundrae]